MDSGPICSDQQVSSVARSEHTGNSPLPEEIEGENSSKPPALSGLRRTPSFVYTAQADTMSLAYPSDDDEVASLRPLTDDDDEFKPLDEELRQGPQVGSSHMKR